MLLFPRAEDRSPWGDFWFTPIGNVNATGVRVTADTSMRLSAVYSCVRLIAETFAMLPFSMSRIVAGKRKYFTDHWLYQRLAVRPNDYQNRFEWHEMILGHLALRGNAYNRIISDGSGAVTQLRPIHPDRIRLELQPNTGMFRYRIQNTGGAWDVVSRGEIWHIKGLSSDGYMGLNPIELASQTIGLGLAAQEYGARFYANDARPGGGWIEHPGNFKDKDSRDNFKMSWQTAQTGANRHKTAVLEWGMKYHELAIKNNDAQFLETRQFQVVDICRIFRVPPHLVMDLTRGTFSNIEQQSLEFMAYSMAPWAERMEASESSNFLEDDAEWQLEYDFTHLMRGDAASRSAYYTGGITNGWMTRNEARTAEGYETLDGLDDPLMPLNMQTVDAAADAADRAAAAPPGGDPDAPGAPADPAEQEQTNPPPAGAARLTHTEQAVHRIAASTAARIIRKECASIRRALANGPGPAVVEAVRDFYRSHADLVSDAFAASAAEARAWCDGQFAAIEASRDVETLLIEWESSAQLRLARAMCK